MTPAAPSITIDLRTLYAEQAKLADIPAMIAGAIALAGTGNAVVITGQAQRNACGLLPDSIRRLLPWPPHGTALKGTGNVSHGPSGGNRERGNRTIAIPGGALRAPAAESRFPVARAEGGSHDEARAGRFRCPW